MTYLGSKPVTSKSRVRLVDPGVLVPLPTDTGEWTAILDSSSHAASHRFGQGQQELVDRIAFADARDEIQPRLEELVRPALDQLTAEAREIVGDDLKTLETACEFDPATRGGFVRATVRVTPSAGAIEFYPLYERLMAAISSARRLAGVENLEVDLDIH